MEIFVQLIIVVFLLLLMLSFVVIICYPGYLSTRHRSQITTLLFLPTQHIQSMFVRIESLVLPNGKMCQLITYVCKPWIVCFSHNFSWQFWHGSVLIITHSLLFIWYTWYFISISSPGNTFDIIFYVTDWLLLQLNTKKINNVFYVSETASLTFKSREA